MTPGDYLEKRENILPVGPMGKRVRFWRVTELVTTLREADQDRHLLRFKQQLAKLDLIILDEFGYVPASKSGADLLFEVIATAYERTRISPKTNLSFENRIEILKNERLTGAALDRLTVPFRGPCKKLNRDPLKGK